MARLRPPIAAAGLVAASTSLLLAQAVVRTADPAKRGLKESDFPRTVKVSDNVYTYEDFHAGDEKFTTTNMFVVTDEGVLVADGQGSPAATKGLVDAIAKVTPAPIKYVVVCSDHGDHTAGNASFPAGVQYLIHPTSKAAMGRNSPADAELVSDTKNLTLGSEPFQVVFLGRAHTGGDPGVYLPRQKILFLSEIFLNRVFPAMRSAVPVRVARRVVEGRADGREPVHSWPRIHRDRTGVEGRTSCLPHSGRSGHRRGD